MDKNKILDAAAKLVAKGAYDKAIKEYQKVLEADPKDVRVLHKLGELYEKKNDAVQAASFFTRVADGYANDGFSMKAIALYKKVLKLDPNLIEVNLKLAELHQQHQLMSEAMAYYQAVANHYDKAGNVRASLDILKKMVDLDPENVASRIKLAELYARENMNAEAGQEFRRAAEYLKRNGRVDDYLRVAERLTVLDPGNIELSRELASEYLARGDQKRALARLQICFKADARDIQTLNLLAQAFQGLGQTSKTISVYKELAKVYADTNRLDEANRTWSKIAQLDPNDPDVLARSAPKPQPAAPAAPSWGAPAQAAAPAPAGPGGLSREQLAKLLTETDVYVKYGLHDKALEHLRRIFAVDPENLDAHEKAYHIYVAANNAQAAGEQLLNVLRLCTRRQEVQRAQPYLATILQHNPNHPEVPAFLAVLRTSDTPDPAALVQEETIAEDAILVDSNDEEIIVADAPEDALAPEHDLALAAAPVDEDSVIVSDDLVDPVAADVVEDPGFQLTSDDEPLTVAGAEEDEPLALEEPVSAEIVVEEPELEEVGLGDDEDEQPTATYQAVSARAIQAPEAEDLPASEECDEASFFLDQGLYEEAREILETVLIAFPGHARARELMARLEAAEADGEPITQVTAIEDLEAAPPQVSPVDSGKDAFDLAAELADELGDLGGDDVGGADFGGDDYQVSVEEVFSEFKKGLQKIVKPEDVDTHYDLGIAYKEMGLIDDAIGEFDVARQGCVGKKKEIDCLTMIGMLQVMKGEPAQAVEAFKQALASEFATPEVTKALRFELATAWEMAGSPGKALFHFQAVAQLDPKFRDVADNLKRLAATTTAEDDPLPGRSTGMRNGAAAPGAPARGGGAAQGGTQTSRKVGYV